MEISPRWNPAPIFCEENGNKLKIRTAADGSQRGVCVFPDGNACAQLGEVRVHRDGTAFFVRLVAYVPAQTDCNPDTIPMRVEIPLNIAYAPEGPSEVNVNGVTASFDHRTVPAAPVEAIAERNLITIKNVDMQVGVGSPLPVEIIASGTWPDLCAQIASVETRMDGFNINITVLASTVENCRPDNLGLPFRFAIPLNTVEMEEGTYTITVNGTSTLFDIPMQQLLLASAGTLSVPAGIKDQ